MCRTFAAVAIQAVFVDLDARDSSEPRSDSCSDSVFHSVLKKADARRNAK
jgi:hypothetical protein